MARSDTLEATQSIEIFPPPKEAHFVYVPVAVLSKETTISDYERLLESQIEVMWQFMACSYEVEDRAKENHEENMLW